MPDDFGDDGGRWASEIAPPHLFFFLEEGGPTCNLLEAGIVNAARSAIQQSIASPDTASAAGGRSR